MCKRRVSVLVAVGVLLLLGVPRVQASGSSDSLVNFWDAWTRDIAVEQLSFVMAREEGVPRSHGVAVCRLKVSNLSAGTRAVRLSSLSYKEGRGRETVQYQQTCTLDPQQSAIVCFTFLPIGDHPYSRTLQVEIDGTPKGTVVLDPFPWIHQHGNPIRQFMLSPSISKAAIEYRVENLSTADHPVRLWSKDWRFLEGQIPVPEWPALWLAYTPADCVVLTKGEWEALPQDVRDALLGYLQAGGGLILAGAREEEIGRYGIPVGFGVVRALSSAVPEEWTQEDVNVLIAVSDQFQWQFRGSWASAPANRLFSPPPLVPVYVMLLGVMLFIGPGLLVILALRDMRIRIYWIAPSIAGGVSLVILLFALFRDGISPVTHARSVLYLNEVAQTQVQLTTLSVMAPAGLHAPLRFPSSSEITPSPSNENFPSGHKTVSLADDLALNSAWVPSRVPIAFLLRDTGPLTVPKLAFDGNAAVTNPYPVPIRRLLYCDAGGRGYALDAPLPPGATATLKPRTTSADVRPQDIAKAVRDIFCSAEPFERGGLLALPPTVPLPPGMYLCELDGTPFLTHPVRQRKVRHQGETIVWGEMQ